MPAMYLMQDGLLFQGFGNEADQETILSGLLLDNSAGPEAG